MGEIELKPCPFCGGKAVYVTKNIASEHYCVGFDFGIECEECEISLSRDYEITFSFSEEGEINILSDERPIAAGKWNKRAGKDGVEE